MIMKKILTGAFCLSVLFAYNTLLKTNKSVSVLTDDVEALSACEVSLTNAKGKNVKYECAGENGTCLIDEEVEVKVKIYGITTTVKTKVQATCSGTRVS